MAKLMWLDQKIIALQKCSVMEGPICYVGITVGYFDTYFRLF